MIMLYLDMDGVLANFDKKYNSLNSKKENKIRFRDAVMTHRIFENLEFMPDTQKLLNHVSNLRGVHVEILTSLGTFDNDRGEQAKIQKLQWLAKKNIPYKANFVRIKPEKAKYATPESILIDDSPGCIFPFIAAGGHGILHYLASESIRILDSTVLKISKTM